jgi:hypothetical protein
VTKHTAAFWSRTFLDELRRTYSVLSTDRPPYLDFSMVLSAYKDAKCRLLLFDYDVRG